jgi:hypothetical protein
MMKVQENKEGLEMNGTDQFLAYTDVVGLLGGNTNIVKNNKEDLLNANKEAALGVNRETKVYVHVLSPHCRAKSLYKGN